MLSQLKDLTAAELFGLHSAVLNEIRERGLSRGMNSPIADLAEQLAAKKFDAEIMPPSNAGFDLRGKDGTRYEVKSRRHHQHRRRGARQLSALHLDEKTFDYLVGVIFNEDCTVKRAALIPWSVVREQAKKNDKTGIWKFFLSDKVWKMPGVEELEL